MLIEIGDEGIRPEELSQIRIYKNTLNQNYIENYLKHMANEY